VIAKRKGGRPKGLPKSGGRTKGTKNKIQSEVKLLAKEHGPAAIGVLARIMKHGENDSDRIAAAKVMLDRGEGRVPNPVNIGGFDGGPITKEFIDNLSREALDAMILKLAEVAGVPKPETGG
jgi:hypothetical protein